MDPLPFVCVWETVGNIAGVTGASFSPLFPVSSLLVISLLHSHVNFEFPFLNEAFLAFVL